MSTQQNTINIGGLTASADLSAKQYHFVEVSGVRTVGACNAITDLALGVLQNDPESGQAATVAIGGTTKIVAGGVITAGQRIAPKADGRAQVAVSTQFARGIALETSAADGDVIECALITLTALA